MLDDFSEKQKGLEIIMAHYGAPELTEFEPNLLDSMLILRLDITSLTAKQSSNWDTFFN